MKDISCCGINCKECYCYGEQCKGCNACSGQVFYVGEGKECPIYECVKNQKKYENCAKCGQVPCDIWKSNRDPKYTDEEFEANIKERLQTLHDIEGV